uniref:HEAT repeat-containing protein 5B n=1 Tax=Panagrolaimus sp. ES5 TaxID=591445 RepID=A0AC34FWX2_9BILA
MRRCISFIFRHTLGEILSEPSQISACKIFGDLLNDYVSSFDCTTEGNDDERILDADTFSSAQVTIVSLLEISALVRQIGTAVTPLFVEASGIMEPVFASGANDCEMGIPFTKSKQVFTIAEDMIKSACQTSKLALQKIKSGWLLVAAVITMATMSLVSDLLYSHGAKLRHSIYTFRIRLYSFLSRLKLKYIESSLSGLLRELVADITLSDNSQSTTCSSLLAHLCTSVESTLLYGWVQNTSQAQLEEELYSTHLASDQTFENDPLSLICSSIIDSDSEAWPEPLPVHVASIDSAIQMFGRVYPLAPTKHKLQLTNHFLNCFKAIKNVNRLQSVQMNVLSAILCAMKSLGEIRNSKIEGEELQKANINLIIPFLNSEKVLLKCLAIETLGHLAQAVSEPQFVAGNAQLCFDKLRTIRDEKSRTGFALSLGVLHRHVGSLGSGQHLNTSVSIILALAQDSSSPTVQAWAILSLSLIATTGGGMFRGYVEPCLSLCLRLLLNTAQTNVEVILCVGKLVSALITSVGPELQMTVGTMDNMRSSFLIAAAMMFEHSDPQIKAEALSCWQQLHLFAPRFVQLDRLVTNICHLLQNPHLVLRK